jgi:Tfp pilus assembly PilM family ATPase/Tfp pilus assembly protein PilN
MKRKDLLIFEATENQLRILRARGLPNQALHVLSFHAFKMEQFSAENLSKTLSTFLTARDKRSQVVVVIPRNQVIFRSFALPSHSKEELQKMITLQMAAQVPYAREDIVFDYSVLGQDPAGYTKVLSAVVHKEVIDDFFKMFKSAGLTIHQLVLSSSSIVRWFYTQHLKQVKNEKTTVGILNIESSRSEFCFARSGQLLYARDIKYGQCDVGADFEDLFIKDIFLTLETFIRDHASEAVPSIYILAPTSIQGFLFDKFQAQKNIMVEFVDPYALMKAHRNAPMLEALQSAHVSPAVCLGAAEESQKISFNLLPEDIRKNQKAMAQKWQLVQLAVLALINAVLFFSIFFRAFYKDQVYLNDLKQQASQMRLRVDDVDRQRERLKQMEGLIDPRQSTVDIIYSLYEMTPKEISFQLLFLDKENNLTVQGIAQTRSSVNDFNRNLTQNPLFKDVSLQYAAQRRFFEGEITDFKITAVISNGKEP